MASNECNHSGSLKEMKLIEKHCIVSSSIVLLVFNICEAVQTTISKPVSSSPGVLNRSVFTVVRFLNVPCTSPNGLMSGLCFSLKDCARLQGTQIGTCANGFGICCTFQRSCGVVTTQNSTHFVNPGYPKEISETDDTICTLTLLRHPKSHLCQIRLDLLDFELARPTEGNCLDDKFTVMGNNLNAPVPEICGRNSGQHMYIEVDNTFGPIHLTVNTKGIGKRRWNIRASYIECTNPSKAPPNCLQYYTGVEGRFSSFNYIAGESTLNTGGYLNHLDYAICFRKEIGCCSITYIADSIDSFIILNLESNNSPTVGSGEAGLGINECQMDYLRLGGDRYCGARLNPSISRVDPTQNAPVTDNTTGPFISYFRTNSEHNAVGFSLQYNQNACS